MRWISYVMSGLLVAAVASMRSELADKVREVEELRFELSVQSAISAQALEAKAVLNSHLDRQVRAQDQLQTDLENFKLMEGYDAPMSDFLLRSFERM